MVMFGGDGGSLTNIGKRDVVNIPAGVANLINKLKLVFHLCLQQAFALNQFYTNVQ